MKHSISLLTMVVALFLFSGCVTKKQFTSLQTEKDKLEAKYQNAQLQLAENKANIKSLEERLAEAQKNNAELKASYAALQNSLDKSIQQNSQGNVNISKLVDEINASNKFIKQLVEAKDKSDSLNMVLTNNLTRSLSTSLCQTICCISLEVMRSATAPERL